MAVTNASARAYVVSGFDPAYVVSGFIRYVVSGFSRTVTASGASRYVVSGFSRTLTPAAFLLMAAPVFAQQPTLAPGCTATPVQLDANKKVATEFFRPGVDRVALADPTYKQHNPAFVKGGREAKLSDYEYFKSRFGGPPRAGGPGAGAGRGAADAPQPPQGNPLEIVMAECDLVTVVHKNFRQDPTAAAGTFYEVFTFDTFRVRNGKLVEHWDGAVINPPAPAGAPGGRGN